MVAFATDPTVQGGAMGSDGCRAIVTAYDRAFADSAPVVGLWHSGGARLREGVASLDGVGRVLAAMTRASGKVPQISVVLGPAAGGAAYGPALTDIVILGPAGRIFVTGPEVVRSVTGEDVDMERLGGPEPHGRPPLGSPRADPPFYCGQPSAAAGRPASSTVSTSRMPAIGSCPFCSFTVR